MRSLRVKLLSCLAVVCLAVAMLVVGIWAAGTQTINLKGEVDFVIGDPSLYVKDIRIKNSMEDASSNGETIDNFVPGYVNTTMNLNLGQIDNSTGGLSIYIDIINTTDTTYVASTTSSISGAEIIVSGTISGDEISQSNILTTDTPSGTVEIVISAPGIAILDLGQISISLDELTYNVSANDQTLGSVSFSVDGDQVTLTATLNNNTEFLGWAENTEDGYVVCDVPTYTFTYTEGMPTTYVAIFRELGSPGSSYSYNDETHEASVYIMDSVAPSEYAVASTINNNGTIYTVTEINGGLDSYSGSQIVTLTFPSTISSFGNSSDGISFCGAANLETVYFRAGFSAYEIEPDGYGHTNVFSLFINNDYTYVSAFIIDSEELLSQIERKIGTMKILASIVDGTVASGWTVRSTEVINGRTYNVY